MSSAVPARAEPAATSTRQPTGPTILARSGIRTRKTPMAGTGGYGWNACFISASRQTGRRGSQQWVVGYPESFTLAEISHAAETIMICEISKQSNPAGVYMHKALYDKVPLESISGAAIPATIR